MSSSRAVETHLEASIASAKRLLSERWPALTVLTPSVIGLAADARAIDQFLAIVESLSDSGYLSYEALVLQADGPILIDAALTARGRAALAVSCAAD